MSRPALPRGVPHRTGGKARPRPSCGFGQLCKLCTPPATSQYMSRQDHTGPDTTAHPDGWTPTPGDLVVVVSSWASRHPARLNGLVCTLEDSSGAGWSSSYPYRVRVPWDTYGPPYVWVHAVRPCTPEEAAQYWLDQGTGATP